MLRVAVAALLAAALVVGVSNAACANGCSGHGSCKTGEVCDCWPRWTGGDCSMRECPYGLSWVTSAETAAGPAGASYSDIPSYAGGAYPGDKTFLGAGGRHVYTECSSRGTCDTSSGQCQCFPGYTGKGCRRMSCPNDCSGHGMCFTNREINAEYKPLGPDSQMWDADMATQCYCDPGWAGNDCSARMCPLGDDPLTLCNQGKQVSDIQQLTWTEPDDDSSAGYFTLTFTDPYGANYTTRPIFVAAKPELNDAGVKTAADIEAALEHLPNFAIPNVTVTRMAPVKVTATVSSKQKKGSVVTQLSTGATGKLFTEVAASASSFEMLVDHGSPAFTATGPLTITDRDGSTLSVTPSAIAEVASTANGGKNTYDITFVDAANAGPQNLLECSLTNPDTYNHASNSPRFHAPQNKDGSNIVQRVCTARHVTLEPLYYPVSHGYDVKEAASCSNRGDCDGSTGICNCWEGFTGEACSEQTVFF